MSTAPRPIQGSPLVDRRRVLALALSAAVLACEPAPGPAPVASSTAGHSPPTAPSASTSTTSARGSLAGARRLIDGFLAPGADHATLTRALAPQPGDHAEVLSESLAAKAATHYAAVFETLAIAPAEGQTELLMWKVTTEELRLGTGDAAKCSPRFRVVAPELAPRVTWYCFKLVVPEKKTGTESEGLVFVNGHWALFVAPWTIR